MTPSVKPSVFYPMRYYFVLLVALCCFLGLIFRSAVLQVLDFEFARKQGDSRIIRKHQLEAYRGIITDRNGVDLAVSIPVDSVWLNPQRLVREPELLHSPAWAQLCYVLEKDKAEFTQLVINKAGRQFIYAKRHVSEEVARYIKRLNLPGVGLINETKRFYPTAEVSAHVVGFTDIDDRGQEGVEKSYNDWLQGSGGAEWVSKDRLGRVIEKNGVVKAVEPGKDLALSIDYRIQNIAYRELKRTVVQYGASTGTIVILDVETGEVLAMANQPSFNPNRLEQRLPGLNKNRAVTDVFEPGSTVKTFTIASALESGRFKPDTIIDTSPGIMRVGGSWVRDGGANYGVLDVAGVLRKSSNVGVSKIALALDTDQFLATFFNVGFGLNSGAGFPGESNGIMRLGGRLSKLEKATLSYGYGLSVTALQLASSYLVLANRGIKKPISIIKANEKVKGQRVMDATIAETVISMLEQVVSSAGTGKAAEITGYRVAGKTGTVRKAVAGGYGSEYIAVFAGFAPIEKPRLAAVIMVNNPSGDYYYGGEVAAPVFAEIMRLALRLINATPDKVVQVVAKERMGG